MTNINRCLIRNTNNRGYHNGTFTASVWKDSQWRKLSVGWVAATRRAHVFCSLHVIAAWSSFDYRPLIKLAVVCVTQTKLHKNAKMQHSVFFSQLGAAKKIKSAVLPTDQADADPTSWQAALGWLLKFSSSSNMPKVVHIRSPLQIRISDHC